MTEKPAPPAPRTAREAYALIGRMRDIAHDNRDWGMRTLAENALAALEADRAAIIEQCARVVDVVAEHWEADPEDESIARGLRRVSARIRALASAQGSGPSDI